LRLAAQVAITWNWISRRLQAGLGIIHNPAMVRAGYFLLGAFSLLLGAVGVLLPLLPTVPFFILAAFFFARGSPALEQWLLRNGQIGPHILAWRARGAISPRGKRAALLAFAVSAAVGLVLMPMPWALIPSAVALVGGTWILTRPSA
jgi:uncharacterized protein